MLADLQALRSLVVSKYALVIKLILETSQLTAREIVATCVLASVAGFDFVKTSTGFLGHGAKEEDVKLMRNALEACTKDPALRVNRQVKIKASGGVKTQEQAVRFIYECGVSRIGMSASVALMEAAVAVGK